MTNGHADQIEFWNGEHGRIMGPQYADIVDIMFCSHYGRRARCSVEIGTGDRALDLGCGNGGTTLAAAGTGHPHRQRYGGRHLRPDDRTRPGQGTPRPRLPG